MTIIVSIEGNIGSGKSRFIAALQSQLHLSQRKVKFLADPVDDWNTIRDEHDTTMLELYYADQAKYAFPFQMMAYISRLSLLRAALKEDNYAFIFTERSVFTDKNVFAAMLREDGKIKPIEYAIYLRWFDEFVQDLPPIQYVHIKTEPEVAHARVCHRARPGEIISLDYLRNCQQYHDQWFAKLKTPLLELDGNEDIDLKPSVLSSWIYEVQEFTENLYYKSLPRFC